MSNLKVATIGGGGGHAQVLKALKTLPGVVITAICPSTDSGGSTGLLQKEYGAAGYLGDLTKCFAALCDDQALAQTLLERYEHGSLYGHSVKNLLFFTLERTAGIVHALAYMRAICNLRSHYVTPVTYERTELCARLRIGNRIVGETNIDNIAQNPLWHPDYHAIQDIYLSPKVKACDVALKSVAESDWCIICPGDLYSSILPVLLPEGMQEALKRPKIAIVLNIMTKRGETDNYRAMDFVVQIESRLNRPCDLILANNTELSDEVLIRYSLEQKVQIDPAEEIADPRMVLAPLVQMTKEGFVYHNPAALAMQFSEVLSKQMT